jgi:hypothetical protein
MNLNEWVYDRMTELSLDELNDLMPEMFTDSEVYCDEDIKIFKDLGFQKKILSLFSGYETLPISCWVRSDEW